MPYQPKKLFTVDEANATLPLVRAIVADLANLSREVIERRERIDHLTEGRDGESGDPYSDELAQIKEELDKDHRRLQEYADELTELGVELKSAPEGLIDFPSQLDGRLVFLCWKFNEPEVLHWHELDGGFEGRQSLTANSIAEGSHDCEETLDE